MIMLQNISHKVLTQSSPFYHKLIQHQHQQLSKRLLKVPPAALQVHLLVSNKKKRNPTSAVASLSSSSSSSSSLSSYSKIMSFSSNTKSSNNKPITIQHDDETTITVSSIKDDNNINNNNNDDDQPNIDLTKFTKEIVVKLPDLVDDGQSAKIIKWYKRPGDIIYPDETICDIETSMFTFGMDVDDECMGVMKEILMQENEETKESFVPICIILHEEDGEEDKDGKDKKGSSDGGNDIKDKEGKKELS